MHQMTETERALREAQKTLHARCRAELVRAREAGAGEHRYALLAWAFVRGINYRRIERRRHFQTNGGRLSDMFGAPVAGRPGVAPFEHNAPSQARLEWVIRGVLGEKRFAEWWRCEAPRPAVVAFLAEPCPDLGALLAADAARGTLEPRAAAE